MPYIKPDRKRELVYIDPETPGDLNFRITELVHDYILSKGLRYATLNEVIGVLECAKLELYRQIAAPYEDVKKQENGPISELDKGKK